ncbi:biliverdin-producing heme oxygenase [Arenibacter sp. M-2]|uniref:biliverdin-producing heme oxygenase n=1 Tax=Arenibacter sp. M-2 TaxID=3053612 RepID=UPI00256FCC2A|nr:biliverdin-producing heme oxygenase [Arenibacter sp. M-2]MDL5511184.1 biliverdin-producing heme oxygenase [Arenibacter sp. M-2]
MRTILTLSTSQDLLTNLKKQTAPAHKKLESLPVSSLLLSPDMEIENYTHYLYLMYNVHRDLEEKVFPLLTEIIDNIELRKKTHLIKEDLSFLNYNLPGSKSVFKDPKCTIPFALGIMYVVEGSSLGGRYILKNIETTPGLNKGKGVSYFKGYGTKTGSKWKSFLNKLIQYENENNCENEIIEGAMFAFDSIYDHFLITEKNEN